MRAYPVRTCVMAAALAAATATFANAQTAEQPKTEDHAEVEVQPEAVGALDRMAAHLRTLKQFRLTAVTTHDEVMEDGQTFEIAGRSTYEVRSPDRLKLEVITDMNEREYYYDGNTVTQYAPALDLYSVFDAPPTVAEAIEAAEEKYGVVFPLADLFYWGTDRSNVGDVSSAHFVGESRIGDNVCDHYAYRAEGADFQVWIRSGGDPLPCRLLVIDTESESRPRYAATLSFEPNAALGDSIFSFAPPPGASRIDQAAVEDGAN